MIVANKAPSIGFSSNILGVILLAGILVWLYLTGVKEIE